MTESPSDIATLLAELPGIELPERLARIRGAGDPDEVMRGLGEAAEQLAVSDAGNALVATECLRPWRIRSPPASVAPLHAARERTRCVTRVGSKRGG